MSASIAKVTVSQIAAAVLSAENVGGQLSTLQGTDKANSAVLGNAVAQNAPLETGGFVALADLLNMMCVPATTGRLRRMSDMIEINGVDWAIAFSNTFEDAQSEDGEGKRTRAYERVKKARQRLVKASEKVGVDAQKAREAAALAERAEQDKADAAARQQRASEEAAAEQARIIESARSEAAALAAAEATATVEALRLRIAELEADKLTLSAELEAAKAAAPKRKTK